MKKPESYYELPLPKEKTDISLYGMWSCKCSAQAEDCILCENKENIQIYKERVPKGRKILAYEDDLRQIDGQHRDFVVLTEFW